MSPAAASPAAQRMIPACDAGPTSDWMRGYFADLRCEREAGHEGAHCRKRLDGSRDWWLGGSLGVSEQLVLDGVAESAKLRAARDRHEAAEAKRRDTKTAPMFPGGAR